MVLGYSLFFDQRRVSGKVISPEEMESSEGGGDGDTTASHFSALKTKLLESEKFLTVDSYLFLAVQEE